MLCVLCVAPTAYSFFWWVHMYIPAQYLNIFWSYLIGSLPISVLLSKIIKMPDPRESGSGNIGVSNVLRTSGNKKITTIVALTELSKGIFACYIAGLPGGSVCILGQVYSLFLKFNGGKGLSILIGCLSWYNVYLAILAPLWFIVSKIFYPSVAAILVLLTYVALLFQDYNLIYLLPGVLLITYRHKENFIRLFQGSEHKIDNNDHTHSHSKCCKCIEKHCTGKHHTEKH